MRPDAIVATGRSDFPNQVNNVLGFPFIFRGALDVRARRINEEMKMAAAYSLAALTKEDVPDSVLSAYGLESLKFGTEYIIPKPLDPRVMLWESPAVAKAAMDSGVARVDVDLDEYSQQLTFRQGMGQQIRYYIMNKAKSAPEKKRVVFAEGEESKIIRAAAQIDDEGIASPILIGQSKVIREKIASLGLDYDPQILLPENFERIDQYSEAFYKLRQRKGIGYQDAHKAVCQPNVFGPMMVKMGDADAFVSGLTYDYPEVIRPALQIHHTHPDAKRAAGVYIIITVCCFQSVTG